MNKTIGYKITEKDIEGTLHFLRTNKNKEATREDAIAYLEDHQPLAHMVAHKVVENENE